MAGNPKDWDQLAEAWEALESFGSNLDTLGPLRPFLRSPILVVGAGQGLLVEALQRSGFDSTGVDFSRRMIARAWERRKISLKWSRAERLPFSDATFSTVLFATGVLDPKAKTRLSRSLYEAKRVLLPGGRILLGIFFPEPELLSIGAEIGYLSAGPDASPERLMALYEAGSDPESRADLIVSWTGVKRSEAFRIAEKHASEMDAMKEHWRAMAEALSRKGMNGLHVVGQVSRSLCRGTFTTERVDQMLRLGGIECVQLIRENDSVVTLVTRPTHP